jgi:flagellar biosynthesis/type III secretory pathway protein FliH
MTSDAALLLFPHDFAAPPAPLPAAPAAPAAPLFTEADLAAARDAGHAAGEAAARAAAAAARQDEATALLSTIAARLDGIADAATQAVDGCATSLARALFAALGAAFPALRATHGEAELRRVIAAVAPPLHRAAAFSVTVHPALAGAAAAALGPLTDARAPAPEIVPDPAVALGDVRISWPDGSAVRDAEAVWQEIVAVLQPAGLLAAPDRTE